MPKQDCELTPNPPWERVYRLLPAGTVEEDIPVIRFHWKAWQKRLFTRFFSCDQEQFILIMLDEPVERDVDAAWAKSPSLGFALNGLAQAMCMEAVQRLMPGAERCLPLPPITPELLEKLREMGCPSRAGASLKRRYAVLTFAAGPSGCERCVLRKECPGPGSKERPSLFPG